MVSALAAPAKCVKSNQSLLRPARSIVHLSHLRFREYEHLEHQNTSLSSPGAHDAMWTLGLERGCTPAGCTAKHQVRPSLHFANMSAHHAINCSGFWYEFSISMNTSARRASWRPTMRGQQCFALPLCVPSLSVPHQHWKHAERQSMRSASRCVVLILRHRASVLTRQYQIHTQLSPVVRQCSCGWLPE